MGIMMRPVREKEEAEIKNHLGQQACHYKRAWRVINTKTQDAFNQYLKDHTASKRKMFWHGSRNENWLNILKTGLVLNPNAVATAKCLAWAFILLPVPANRSATPVWPAAIGPGERRIAPLWA